MEDFNAWKEKLRDNSNIVNVVSKYVPLTRKGNRYWANCPFHFEKTPSFEVNEMGQFFHCYGCGVSGDVFNFVQKIESCDFIEACEILAQDANMKMPTVVDNESINKAKKQKEIALNVLREAANYYVKNLFSEKGKPAQDYVERRKLKPETVKHFALGYSVGWNEVVAHLSKLNFSLEDMELAGIVAKKEGKVYDAYAKRLLFPIVNTTGNVIGFSARILEDADFAKYKNTTQTVVFDKSKVLYGLQNIKQAKREAPLHEIIIVEGQMDLVSIWQEGVKNAVATMGTALTPLHAKELKRYCDKVVLCFDGDSAGKKATARSIDILAANGLEVYVVSLPEKMDPDEYVNKNGKDAFVDLVKNALYWADYSILELSKQYNLSLRNEKSEFIAESLKVVQKLESESKQTLYLELIKNKTNISVDVLKQDFMLLQKNEKPKQLVEKTNDEALLTRENAYAKAVKFVLAALLFQKTYATYEAEFEQYLLNADYQKIYHYILTSYESGKKPIASQLFSMFEVEQNDDVKAIIEYEFNAGNDSAGYFEDCMQTIKRSGLLQLQAKLTANLRAEKDLDARKKIAEQLNQVMIKLRNAK